MKKNLWLLFLPLFSALAYGQLVETPVPFDSGGKIMEWDRKMDVKAGLFSEVADFRNAVLWKADSVFTIEITSGQGRLRRSLTVTSLDSLRSLVDAFLSGKGREYDLDQEGRGAYLLWQIPLSLGWYGPAVVTLFEPEDGATAAGLYLTSAAATYFIPFLLTKNSTLTSGQEHMSVAYGFRGIAAGGALSALLGLDDSRAISGMMLGTSISGQVAGYKWGKNFTKPQGRIISHYATFGLTDLPLLTGVLWEEADEKVFSAASLVGLAGGTYLGNRFAKGKDISDGEPTIIATSGWMGMAAGAGLYLAFAGRDNDDGISINSRSISSCCLLGNAGGLYLGHRFIKDYAFSRGDGFIVIGTSAGGALLGAGLGFLVMPKNSGDGDKFRLITGAATVGMLGGYALGIKTVRNQEHKRFSRLDINFDGVPLGLAMAACKAKTKIPWITGSF